MRRNLSDCLRHSAARFPEQEALVYRITRLTYHAFDREVDQVAALLLEADLQKNARCAVYMEKSIEEAVSLFAVNRAGGIIL